PLPLAVVAFVLEAHADAVAVEAPEVLAERVVELTLPLLRQEGDDLRPAADEDVSISPDRVVGVGARDSIRVTGVPGVLARLHLLGGGLGRERRQGWAFLRHAGIQQVAPR